MILYSLATHSRNTGNIDVSLYLTEWQAYEALANDLMPWDEDGPDNIEQVARCEALKARLHTDGVTREIVALFHAALDEQEMVGTVSEHDHPWTLPEPNTGTQGSLAGPSDATVGGLKSSRHRYNHRREQRQ